MTHDKWDGSLCQSREHAKKQTVKICQKLNVLRITADCGLGDNGGYSEKVIRNLYQEYKYK